MQWDYAQSQGLQAQQGTLEPGALPSQSFDIVSLVEVIEHLAKPRAALQALSEILRPKGMVLVQTANFLGWQAALGGSAVPLLFTGSPFLLFDKKSALAF